LLEVI